MSLWLFILTYVFALCALIIVLLGLLFIADTLRRGLPYAFYKMLHEIPAIAKGAPMVILIAIMVLVSWACTMFTDSTAAQFIISIVLGFAIFWLLAKPIFASFDRLKQHVNEQWDLHPEWHKE